MTSARSPLLLVTLLAGCFEYDKAPARDAAADDLAPPVSDLSADLIGGRGDGIPPEDLAVVGSSGQCLAQINTGGCSFSQTGMLSNVRTFTIPLPPGTVDGDVVLAMAWNDETADVGIAAPFVMQASTTQDGTTATWAYWVVSGALQPATVTFSSTVAAGGGGILMTLHGLTSPAQHAPFGVTATDDDFFLPAATPPAIDVFIAASQETTGLTYAWLPPSGWSTLASGTGVVAFGRTAPTSQIEMSFSGLTSDSAYPLAADFTTLSGQ